MTNQKIKQAFCSRSLSVKFQAFLMPAVALVFVLFGFYMYALEKRDAEARNEELATYITGKANQALINWIQSQIDLAQTIAEDPRLVALCLHPTNAAVRAEAQSFLSAMMKRYPNNENIPVAIRLGKDDGFDLAVGEKTVHISTGNFIIDTVEGKTIGRCGPQFSYIKEVFAGKPYFISEVYPSILRGNPIFVIAAPVRSGGKIIGVAVLAPRMDAFTSVFIEQSKIGRTGYLTMLDERGMIISHPQKDLILNQEAAPKVADIMQKIQAGETHFISTFDGRVKQYHVDRFSSDEFNILHTWYILFGQELTEINEEAAHLLARVIWCMLILLAALSALTVLFSHLLITRPLKRLTIVANHVADGDLSRPLIEVKRNDEIGVLFRAINKMTESLQRQTRQIQEALGVLADSTGYIVSASQQQEALARQNGTATTSVTAAVKEITATSRELARTMQAVQQRSEVTGELADGGRAGLGEMQQSMGHLDGARQSILTRLEQINEKAGLIGNVVTMVGKVAGQTNILSLNASIEAERAGEYGRGFSVVAREMRRLADQTAVAMLNIERSISEMQGAVTAGVMEMDKFSSEVQQSIASVDTIHSRLSEIIQNVGELTPQFMQVNEGMQAQYEGAEHIAQAMTHISEGASETGASITRMNEAIQRLNDAAEALKYEISRFRLGG